MKKGNKFILSIIITISFLVLVYGIYLILSESYYKEKFGLNLNETRVEYCIPIIEESWNIIDYNENSIRWGYLGFPTIKKPFHYRKESILSKGKIIVEKDTYQYNFSDSIEYRLIIWNDFNNTFSSRSKLITYHLFNINIGNDEFVGTDVVSDTLDLKGMTKILKDWEIENFYPNCIDL